MRPRASIATARSRMKKRRDRFVVGFVLPGNSIYGKDRGGVRLQAADATWPMTRLQAERFLVDPENGPVGSGALIFELIPVKGRS